MLKRSGAMQDTALLSTVANCERFREPSHINHSSSHAIMERFDDVHELVRTTKFSQKCPQAIAAYSVKCSCQVNECQVKVFLLLATFFLQLSSCGNHVHSATTRPEARLRKFPREIFLQCYLIACLQWFWTRLCWLLREEICHSHCHSLHGLPFLLYM